MRSAHLLQRSLPLAKLCNHHAARLRRIALVIDGRSLSTWSTTTTAPRSAASKQPARQRSDA